MSDNCGHCEVIGKASGAICKTILKGGGIAGKVASFPVCAGVSKAATVACEKVSHCSTKNSAEWKVEQN